MTTLSPSTNKSRLRRIVGAVRIAFQILRVHGPVAFLKHIARILGPRITRFGAETALPQPIPPIDILNMRFPALKTLSIYPVNHPGRRLNIVTDSINSGSLYGGVATSLILGSLLAEQWNCPLRVVTRTEPAHTRNFSAVLSANGITHHKNVEFVFANLADPVAQLPIGDGDIFLTTSWWTTESVRRAVGSRRIIYLLQEDERSFFPFGDDMLRCINVFNDPQITFIINTQLLYDFLVSEGFTSIQANGHWFEPSTSVTSFFYDPASHTGEKQNFFFYARPGHLRNLFYLGLETIEAAIAQGVLDPHQWNFHFVGKHIPLIQLDPSVSLHCHQDLSWAEYAALVRQMDLGLSLMHSPHPSYPPLDLAASGAVAVTNRYNLKQDLSRYSPNIICCDLTMPALLQGLAHGVQLSRDHTQRLSNYANNRFIQNWPTAFNRILVSLADFSARE